MDPQICWSEMLEAIEQTDWDSANEKAEDLIEWLDKLGFAPKIVAEWPAVDGFVARSVCNQVFQVVAGLRRAESTGW